MYCHWCRKVFRSGQRSDPICMYIHVVMVAELFYWGSANKETILYQLYNYTNYSSFTETPPMATHPIPMPACVHGVQYITLVQCLRTCIICSVTNRMCSCCSKPKCVYCARCQYVYNIYEHCLLSIKM